MRMHSCLASWSSSFKKVSSSYSSDIRPIIMGVYESSAVYFFCLFFLRRWMGYWSGRQFTRIALHQGFRVSQAWEKWCRLYLSFKKRELLFSFPVFRIQEKHAVFSNQQRRVSITPVSGSKVIVNGVPVSKRTELHHLVCFIMCTS